MITHTNPSLHLASITISHCRMLKLEATKKTDPSTRAEAKTIPDQGGTRAKTIKPKPNWRPLRAWARNRYDARKTRKTSPHVPCTRTLPNSKRNSHTLRLFYMTSRSWSFAMWLHMANSPFPETLYPLDQYLNVSMVLFLSHTQTSKITYYMCYTTVTQSEILIKQSLHW